MKQTFLHGLIAVVGLSISLTAAALQTAAGPAMTVLQPAYVSATDPTPLTCAVETSAPAEGTLAVYLLQPEDVGPVLLLDRTVSLQKGRNELTLSLNPESLHGVPLFGDFTIRLVLSLAGGGRATAELESTLLPRLSRSLTSRWSIGFTGKPALLYTTGACTIDVGVSNPKSAAKTAKIKLKFMDERGRKKVKMPAVAVTLVPGENTIHLKVPAGVATLASQRGDVRGKVVLKVGGVVKATDEAQLDYDLAATASADATSGRAPLDVAFQAEASGGAPPYTYAWDFGDGTSSGLQSPDHTYGRQGTFPAAVTVTDGLGGAVTRSIEVSVDYPELLAGCQATPTEGTAPLTVAFTASVQGGDGDFAYEWDFGDGGSSVLASPTHTYGASGVYNVRLIVGSGNQTAECSEIITVGVPSNVITASAGKGGAISPSGAVPVQDGADLTLAITPDNGYEIADVLVDGQSVGKVTKYTFTNIQADHTIEAVFTRTSYVITASATDGGTVSPSGEITVAPGGSQAFTFSAAPGFLLTDVLMDGVSLGPISIYIFSDVQADHTIQADFTPVSQPPVITGLQANPSTLSDANGSSTITFTLSNPDGGSVTWTASLSGSTSTGDLGTLNTGAGTVASGSQVTLSYQRGGKTGSGSATVTIEATNSSGQSGVPQSVTITLL